MKTLAQVDETKNANTGKAGDVVRQLVFAGFAVTWLLRGTQEPIVPAALNPAVAMFAATLALDLLQYATASLMWVVFYNHQFDLKKSDSAKIDIPGWMNWPAYWCFWLKIITAIIGWGYLADFALAKWKWPELLA